MKIAFLIWLVVVLALVGMGLYTKLTGRSADERAGAFGPYFLALVIFVVGLIVFAVVGVLS